VDEGGPWYVIISVEYCGFVDLIPGNEAEAVNLWIGSAKSVTSFHHDPYVPRPQIRGERNLFQIREHLSRPVRIQNILSSLSD